jgi:hypothetical protein
LWWWCSPLQRGGNLAPSAPVLLYCCICPYLCVQHGLFSRNRLGKNSSEIVA